jgi:hypothetical protein
LFELILLSNLKDLLIFLLNLLNELKSVSSKKVTLFPGFHGLHFVYLELREAHSHPVVFLSEHWTGKLSLLDRAVFILDHEAVLLTHLVPILGVLRHMLVLQLLSVF